MCATSEQSINLSAPQMCVWALQQKKKRNERQLLTYCLQLRCWEQMGFLLNTHYFNKGLEATFYYILLCFSKFGHVCSSLEAKTEALL